MAMPSGRFDSLVRRRRYGDVGAPNHRRRASVVQSAKRCTRQIDDQIKASPIRHEKATLLGEVKFGGRSNVAFGDYRRA